MDNKTYKKPAILYVRICFFVLFITGLAKIISSFGFDSVLMLHDPLLLVSNKTLMLTIGLIELSIALFLAARCSVSVKLQLVSWFALMILAYRAGLWWIGWSKPCPCLGNITAMIRLKPETADFLIKLVLLYLLMAVPCLFFGRSESKPSIGAGKSH